jgi:hypothetical protein
MDEVLWFCGRWDDESSVRQCPSDASIIGSNYETTALLTGDGTVLVVGPGAVRKTRIYLMLLNTSYIVLNSLLRQIK